MTAPVPQLHAIEIDLDRAAREIFALRDRVARLRLESAPACVLPPVHPGGPASWSPPPAPRPTGPAPAEPTPPAGPSPEDYVAAPPWWRREGAVARVLSVAGAGVLLLGVTFLLVLAVQHGYFGPVPRVVVGSGVAAALVVLGAVVHRRQAGNPGAVALAGTGIAGGYLVVVAVTTVYGWVGLPWGLLLAGAVCGLGVVLARRWDDQVLAVIVLLGVSALAPGIADDTLWAADAFLVVVAAVTTMALGRRDWPVLHVARVVPAALVLSTSALLVDRVQDPFAAWAVAGLTAVFALVTVIGELRTGGAGHRSRSAVLAALAIVPALLAPLWTIDGWVSTLWLAVLAAAWLALSTRARTTLLTTVLVAAGAVSLLLGVGSLQVQGALTPSVLLVAVVFVGAGVLRADRVVGRVGLVVGALGLLGFLPVTLPLNGQGNLTAWDLGSSMLTLVLVTLGHRFLGDVVPAQRTRWSYAVLLPAALLAVLGACVTTGALLGRLAGDPTTGFLAGHGVATLAWLAGAGAGLLTTMRAPDVDRLRAAVVVTGLAVAKLLLFDLATLDGLIRVGVLVVVGAVLLAVGTRYARSTGTSTTGTSTTGTSLP